MQPTRRPGEPGDQRAERRWLPGRPFFGAAGAGGVVCLDNPARVVRGDRVTHVLYDVSRPSA
ncbi:hypothetical protein [Polymorphospora sp. NPDC050346]|uniref:hypothetical protein n=1 Tax=Polymorphospora sp. NPDC050346 TaxID=3155780 RepID=UPI0033F9759B